MGRIKFEIGQFGDTVPIDENICLYLGNCKDVLKTFPDNCVDSVVCDPPYGLEFMGKEWDSLGKSGVQRKASVGGGDRRAIVDADAWGGADGQSSPYSRSRVRWQHGDEGPYAMQEWHEEWALEVLRVLKPGGHLLAFGGTRTYHRMAVAIEDIGFEIRDSVHWFYGSGFPKSMNISKAIKKTLDNGTQQWDGWGTALKPSHEPIILARKPLSEKTIVANVLEWDTGALNIDATRITTHDNLNGGAYSNSEDAGQGEGVWRGSRKSDTNSMKNSGLPGQYEQPPGRWPANIIFSHADECIELGTTQVKSSNASPESGRIGGKGIYKGAKGKAGGGHADENGLEEVSLYACVPYCPVRVLDSQSGDRKSGGKVKGTEKSKTGQNGIYGTYERVENKPFSDTGGASRFFYVAKAARSERNAGLTVEEGVHSIGPMAGRGQPGLKCKICDKWKVSGSPCICPEPDWEQSSFQRPAIANDHPTVKPITLMQYLVRMVTPPNGVVLDPFMGSGTTGIAAKREGFRFIGIEMDEHYLDIARKRIEHD